MGVHGSSPCSAAKKRRWGRGGLALAVGLALSGALGACAGDPALTSGKVYLDQGKAEDAIRQLEIAVRNNPSSWEARYYLGWALIDAEEYAGAAEALEEAMDLADTAADRRRIESAQERVQSLSGDAAEPKPLVASGLKSGAPDTPTRYYDEGSVAVLDFAVEGYDRSDEDVGRVVAELVRAQLGKGGYVSIVERERLAELEEEIHRSMSECTSMECVLGRMARCLSSSPAFPSKNDVSELGRSLTSPC